MQYAITHSTRTRATHILPTRMMAVLRALVATCEKNFMTKNKNDLDALKAAVFLGPHASSPIDMRKISYIPHHIINADGAPTAVLWTRLMADTRDAEIDATYSQEELDKLGPEMRDYRPISAIRSPATRSTYMSKT